jgi:cell wall-associated NlpC family hydrolase
MTQGIVGWRRENWPSDAVAQNEEPPWAPAVTPRPPDPTIDHPIGILTPPMPRMAVDPAAPPTTAAGRDAQVRARLDAFLLSMSQTYRTEKTTVITGTTFQMSVLYESQRNLVRANQGMLVQAAIRANLTREEFARVREGRGSPGGIHALTQSLLDLGALPKPSSPDAELPGLVDQIRTMMFQHGIGIDCAGYVQQAYLHAMRIDAATAHFASPTFEDLSNLGARGYKRIEDLAAVRPGDLVVLGQPAGQPGHRAIVYDQHPATASDLAMLAANGPEAAALASSGPIRIFEVDSSWGCSGNPLIGGVRRETWWYAETNKTWGWLEQGPARQRLFATADTPLAHPFTGASGIFRGAGRP